MNHAFGQSTTKHIGGIGFRLPKGRLPWSTLGGDLEKKGSTLVNWLEGVLRDKDVGISGLSAEDMKELHDALFRDERRLQFVRCRRWYILVHMHY